jgi:hypothetical protein
MPKSAKETALAEVSRAQSKFERTRSQLSQDGRGRRESFERAQSAGATLREIAEAAGLHWSSVAEALRKK